MRALPVIGLVLLAACGSDLASSPDGGSGDGAPAAPDLLVDPGGPGGPPYPIVLVHGMAGFRNLGPMAYFYGVAEVLRKDGHDVWVSRQDPINDSEVRGAEVQNHVDLVLSSTGKRKVVMIGHSQGGFDARYVASVVPERVAAVVTIASPMAGDPIADLVVSVGPGWQSALSALLDLYGAVNGYDSAAKRQIAGITTAGAADFFRRHPDDPRVAYFSITGRSAGSRGEPDCLGPRVAPFVSRWNGSFDPLDPLFGTTGAMLDRLDPRPVHDGLVTVASARHGTFLGCIPADHLDEVNLLFGDSPGVGNAFDAVRFYRDLAAWLVEQGY